MVEAEACLMQKAAEICLRMDKAFLQAQSANLPEPEKSAVVHLAGNAALSAGAVLNGLVRRFLRTL